MEEAVFSRIFACMMQIRGAFDSLELINNTGQIHLSANNCVFFITNPSSTYLYKKFRTKNKGKPVRRMKDCPTQLTDEQNMQRTSYLLARRYSHDDDLLLHQENCKLFLGV